MKLVFSESGLLVIREDGDKRFLGNDMESAESDLLDSIRRHLLSEGYDVIHKRAWKGSRQWIRSKDAKCKGNFSIHNPGCEIFDAGERLNECGEVQLAVTRDIWG